MSEIFEYALIRVVPRIDRGEAINVGVIVYSKSFRYLRTKIGLNEDRLRALSPGTDMGAVRGALSAFVRACTEGPLAEQPLGERFRWLTAPRSAIVQPGPVHAGITDDPGGDLDRLFATLVASLLPTRHTADQAVSGRAGKIIFVSATLAAARKQLAAYPELAAVLAAAVIGLCVQRPLAWLAAHQGINVLLIILVFATAVTIDPRALRRLAAAWPRVLAAVLAGITVLPALSWAVARLVPSGPLRDGVLVTGLAPCEIASVGTTALAGGEAVIAAGVLVGSTLATVVLAAPILSLEVGHASFSAGGVIENLAVVVALPLAAGIALRSWPGPAARALATSRAETAASRTALGAVAVLVALVAAEVRLAASYAAVAAALALFLAASAVLGRALGARSGRPAGSALLLTTSMRDFAIAAALAAAAFGPKAAAPLGLYGVAVLVWGTAAAGVLRARQAPPGRGDRR